MNDVFWITISYGFVWFKHKLVVRRFFSILYIINYNLFSRILDVFVDLIEMVVEKILLRYLRLVRLQ